MSPLKFIRKIPLSLSGTALAFASLGNALVYYEPFLRPLCGLMSAFLTLLVLTKLIFSRGRFVSELEHPGVAGAFANFPSAMMILSTYLPQGDPAMGLWSLGLILNIILIIGFTHRFIISNFDFRNVSPSWFVAYIGIVNASIASPHHNLEIIGMKVFWLTFLVFIPLMGIVLYRVFIVKDHDHWDLPLLGNFASPAALLLTGYLKSVQNRSLLFVYLLLGLTLLLYLFALLLLPRLIKQPFSPSFSSFTGPFVISALAAGNAGHFLSNRHENVVLLKPLVSFQVILGTVLCLFVLLKYIQHYLDLRNLFSKKDEPDAPLAFPYLS